MWPECKIVHGKPRHSQSQGSVEAANKDIERRITCWLHDHHTNNWVQALPFVQFAKNQSLHSGIGRTPYDAMFGIKAVLGVEPSAILPPTIISVMHSVDDLENALQQQFTAASAPSAASASAALE